MNRNHHRIVFNAARGQLMAVSEAATACTGSAAKGEGPAPSLRPTRWLRTGAALLTALAALNSQAQISADPTAAGNLRPTVLSAPNGVPLVNITTPSAAGVSRNVYRQFDVGTQGAILNNSRTNVQTQLGGWVQGNPWLARGPARVILNEVNSSQPSYLNGWVEVGGQRAEVVIANPAGIQVNGGGFINASRATLTTGTPVMNAGALEGFRVQGGQVRIEGLGLDASTTDHAAILARAIEVNAGIWAKALTVVAGVNDVSADTSAITALAAASAVGPAPAFALDVAALGGMYAGQIHLVGTEAGLGVRNAGSLGANSGALVLDANGWLHNSGSLITAQTLDLSTAGNAGITQHGLIDAQSTRITTGELVNEGAGRIYGDTIDINATTLKNDTGAVIAARNTLTATAGTLINREGALLLSGGNMTLAASERLENRSASIEALGNLTITTPVLVNANDHMTHTVVTDATTNHTVYFTPGGAVDASEVAWRVVKPLDGFSQDAYDAYQREWLVPKSSAWADPAFKNYYLGALPFVAGHIESFSDGESGSSWWVGDAFTYSRQSPIWAHFGMTAPTWDAPGQKPGGSFDSEGNLISPPDPQALAAWEAQAAPWVELTARVAPFKTAVESQFLRFDAYSSYAQTTQRAVMTGSKPARMVSAGAMNLNVATSALNQDSEIVAGGALSITAVQVNNQATEVSAPTSRSGTLDSWGVTGRDCDLFGCDPEYGWIQTPYAETIANYVKLPALRYEHNSDAVPSSGTHPPLSPTLGNALFNLSPDPDAWAVFETDPRFASHRQWLSSDHLLSALAVDPATTQKRLGDGFIEQRLIREQVSALTGQRFLDDFTTDEQQYQALMNAGATFAQAHQLRPGITLSANQVAALTSDIVWLETQTVTLPDGSTTQALVPRVYLLPRAGDLSAGGALIAGRDVQMNLSGDILNSGTIAGRDLVQINAQNVLNTGLVSGQSGVITAREDVNNIGGTISAADALIVRAGRDLNVQTTTAQGSGAAGVGRYSSEQVNRVAGLYVSGEAGVLLASAGRDVNLTAAALQASSVDAQAGRDLNLATVNTGSSLDATRDTRNFARVQQGTEVGTQIQGTSINLQAGQDITARAASVQAEGALRVDAGRDVSLSAGESSYQIDHGVYAKSSGLLSSSSTETRTHNSRTDAVGTTLGGAQVIVQGGRDVSVRGSSAIADEDNTINAGRDVSITAAQTRSGHSSFREEKSRGFSMEGASVSLGSQQQSTNQQSQGTGAAASTVGAISGDVNISAGRTYTQTGSGLLAPGGDITVQAQSIAITEARKTNRTDTEQKFKQTGLTLAVSSPVLSALQTISSQLEAAGDTKDARMKGLAAANSAFAAQSALDAIQAGQGTTIDGKANQVVSTNLDGSKTTRDANAADQAGGINLSISIGSRKSQSNSRQTSDSARGSTVSASGAVRLLAITPTVRPELVEGLPAPGSILIRGSEVSAGTTATLNAEGDVALVAAQNTASLSGSNKSSSGSIGLSFGTSGVGITASASAARGKEAGDDLTHTNTHITAGNTVVVRSGGDTTLQGALVKADKIQAEVGGNLLIESLQDTSTYASRQKSVGASATIGAGAGGSFSASNSRANSDFTSVAEQSGFKAGDGGFVVGVRGHTELIGGAITSNQRAVEDELNSFTTGTLTSRDLQNSAHASAKSSGVHRSSDMVSQGNYGVAKAVIGNALNNASESGSSSGQTLATVSGARVTITNETEQKARTGQTAEEAVASLNRDADGAHTAAQKLDAQGMQQRVEAERVIKQAVVATAIQFTDEAYRKIFLEKHPIFELVRDESGKTVMDPETGRPVLRELSDTEKTNLKPGADGKVHIATNGIFNGPGAAGTYANQHGTSNGPQYIIHFPEANSIISELMVAGYQSFLENNFTGLSNSTIQTLDYMKLYGVNGLHLDGHSRGSMTIGNALESLNTSPESPAPLSNTSINFFGPAYSAEAAARLLNELSGGEQKSVGLQNHVADPVGRLVGGNPPTGGTIPEGSSPLTEMWRAGTGQANTTHNCYGPKAPAACRDFWLDSPHSKPINVPINSQR